MFTIKGIFFLQNVPDSCSRSPCGTKSRRHSLSLSPLVMVTYRLACPLVNMARNNVNNLNAQLHGFKGGSCMVAPASQLVNFCLQQIQDCVADISTIFATFFSIQFLPEVLFATHQRKLNLHHKFHHSCNNIFITFIFYFPLFLGT